MKTHRFLSFPSRWALGLVGVVAGVACSSSTGAPAAGACDASQCAPKNECIDDGTETKCRLPCASHADCPFNYLCRAGGVKPFCVKTTLDIAKKPGGQWGAPCQPSGGEANPACDADTGFGCYATAPSDATAYCTRFECTTDLDCAGDFWCGTVNESPNATSTRRSKGTTRTVCLKRSYCSPCAADFDCPIIDGKQSRCIDDDGGAKFCAAACENNTNCPLDASCAVAADDGTKLCYPRAGTCKGDGSMCSPCRSDADCPDGLCLRGAYNTERFCSVTSPSGCADKTDCPAFSAVSTTRIGCQTTSDDPNIPKGQCIGVVPFGETGDIGCYTKH